MIAQAAAVERRFRLPLNPAEVRIPSEARPTRQALPMPLPEYERNSDDEPQLRPSLVLFADLLGTVEHAKAENAAATLAAMDVAFRRARKRSDIDGAAGHGHVAWFSDNVGIAVPLTPFEAETSIGFTILSAMWLQFELARLGFFVRGGLAVGNHYADDSFQFGPALVDAVHLEKAACHPRVVLSDEAVRVVDLCAQFHSELDSNPFHYELATEGGKTFISYLDGVVGEVDDINEVRQVLELHRMAVSDQLHAGHVESVRLKYEWLADYHDFVVGHWLPDEPQLKLDGPSSHQFARYEPPTGLPVDASNIYAALGQILE